MCQDVYLGANAHTAICVRAHERRVGAATQLDEIEALNEDPLWRRRGSEEVTLQVVGRVVQICEPESGLPLAMNPCVPAATVTVSLRPDRSGEGSSPFTLITWKWVLWTWKE